MKLFKNVLVIIALFTIGSAFAKRTGVPARSAGKPTPPVLPSETGVPAPAIPKKQFSFLLDDIRKMNQKNVINEDGDFTDSFISMIQSSGLAPAFMIELLVAGRNLHMPLSGNDEVDLKVIAYNDAFIGDFMANLEPAAPAPSPDSAQQSVPNFYNEANNLLNLVWLENNIKSLLQSNSTDADFAKFKDNTMSAMVKQWNQRNINIKNMQSLEERALNQIDNMTKKIKEVPQTVPVKSEPLTPETGAIVLYQPEQPEAKPLPEPKVKPLPEAQQPARPEITQTYILNAIDKAKIDHVGIGAWLNNRDTSNDIIYTLLAKLKEIYPDAVNRASRQETAKNILLVFIAENNGEAGVKTEDENILFIKDIMSEKKFGVDVIKK